MYPSASAFSLANRVHVLIQEVGIRYSCDVIGRKPNVNSSLEPTGCFSVSWSTWTSPSSKLNGKWSVLWAFSDWQQRVMNGWVVHCYRTSRYFLATDFAALTGNPEDPTSSLSWNVSVFWSYEKVFQNSCRQELKKAPLTEGIKPKECLSSVMDSFVGLFFFLASMIYLYKEEEILDSDSADVSSPERWQMVWPRNAVPGGTHT